MPPVTLVVPPQMDPSAPDVALIALGARVLAAGGRIFDANRDAFATFLSADHAAERRALLEAEAAGAEAADRLDDGALAYAYYRLIRSRLLRDGPDRATAARMLSDISDPTLGAARQAPLRREAERRLDIAVAPYHGQLRLNDLTAVHTTERSTDLAAAAADPTFPYRAFWEDRLRDRASAEDTWCLWIETDQQLLPTAALLAQLEAERAAGGAVPRLVVTGPMADTLAAALRSGALTAPDVDLVTDVDLLASESALGQRLGLPALKDAGSAEWHAAVDALHPATGAAALRVASDATADRLASDLRAAKLPDRARRLILTAPRSPEALTELANAWDGQGLVWTPTLRFGRKLDPTTARLLYKAGVRSLTFEVKGFAGWPDEAAARDGLLSGWDAARSAGLGVALNIVFGYPADSVESFRRFAEFMAEYRDRVDRVQRLKLYRVPVGSPVHKAPESLGITELIPPPSDADLARTLGFRTATGLDSEAFFGLASEMAGLLKGDPADLPPSPLHVDDAGIVDEASAAAVPDDSGGAPPQTVSRAADLVLVSCRFDYRKLDALYADYRPRPDNPPPAPGLDAAPCFVAYRPATGRIVALSEVLAQLLQKADAPVSPDALAADFPPKAKPKIDKAIDQLLRSGLMQPA
jgi:hypothetical protein